ncbi:hypothetical protein AVEN_223505-1 [Araneus ventricosus]|uniref:Uncharacterized protein n=1 Tax=Araneus ventricosus TaxID=182803 RepID=A0A4Y2DLR4_ARAVE|nr:hypothetical protein AVEN_223505-1 [Araneus ventricosus]
MPTPYEKETEHLRKILAEVEADENPVFYNDDNGPEDVLEEVFSDRESFCEHDTESEDDGYSGTEDVNNLELLALEESTECRKTKFRQNIRCHNIVSRLLGTKEPTLFINI